MRTLILIGLLLLPLQLWAEPDFDKNEYTTLSKEDYSENEWPFVSKEIIIYCEKKNHVSVFAKELASDSLREYPLNEVAIKEAKKINALPLEQRPLQPRFFAKIYNQRYDIYERCYDHFMMMLESASRYEALCGKRRRSMEPSITPIVIAGMERPELLEPFIQEGLSWCKPLRPPRHNGGIRHDF